MNELKCEEAKEEKGLPQQKEEVEKANKFQKGFT